MMRQAALNWRDRVLDVLSHVPDPEIPVVSVVELGIVRDVQENPPRVVITTTYSGCPATQVIQADIRKALDDAALPLPRAPWAPSRAPSEGGTLAGHGRVAGCAVHGRDRIWFCMRSGLPTSIGPLLGDEKSVKVRDIWSLRPVERRGCSASTSLGAAAGPAGT